MRKTCFIVIFACTAVLMTVLNALTPFAMDDWHMKLMPVSHLPIQGIGDICSAVAFEYLDHTGRILSHFLYRVFDVYCQTDKTVFDIINSVMFIVMVAGIYLHAAGRWVVDNVLLLLVLALLFTCVEGFGQSFLWVAGAFNYMWMIAFMLIYTLPYRMCRNWDPGVCASCLYGVVGVVVGIGMENLSLGVSLTILAYIAFIRVRHEHIRLWQIAGAVGLWAGTLVLFAAPGNYVRMNEMGIGSGPLSYISNAMAVSKIFLNKDCLFVPLVISALLAFTAPHFNRRTLAFMILSLMLSTYAMCMTDYFPPRTRTVSVVLAIIVCSYLFSCVRIYGIRSRGAVAVLLLAVIVSSWFDAVRTCREVSEYFASVDNMVLNAVREGRDSVGVHGYVGRNRFCIFDNTAVFNSDPDAWTNREYAREKGIGGIYVDNYDVTHWAD